MSEDAANPPTDDAPELDGAETAPQDAAAAPEGAEDASQQAEGDDAMAAAALAAATDAVDQLSTEATGASGTEADATSPEGGASPLSLPSFAQGDKPGAEGLDLLDDVSLDIRVELGRTMMMVEDVLKLGDGAVVELDKLAGDPVDIYANGRHIARGEVLVLNDNFCIRVNEIVAAALDDDEEGQEADAA